MKNYTAFLILAAATSLGACSHNGYSSRNDNDEVQYSAHDQESRQYNSENEDYKGWKEAKLDAMVDHFFDKADTDHDGYISWKEFENYMHKKFRESDKNHDGKLSRDEVKAMMDRHMREIHKGMHEQRDMDYEPSDDNH